MTKRPDKNLIVGLDVGTSKVVAIVGEVNEDGDIEVVGIGSHPSRGLKKGVVVNIESTVHSIQRAVEEAELMAGCDIHSVYTGIAGSHVRSLNSHGIVAIRDKEVSTSDVDRVIDAARKVVGAYSLIALTNKKLVGMRDPAGVRPLVLGEFEGAPILASETCALDIIGAEFVREIEPGELVVCTKDGVESVKPFATTPNKFCIFEYVYFSRPDSICQGRSVYSVRKEIGSQLAKESHVESDLVIPVPDSGTPAAIGYAQEANIPFELGIIRNHYVGRTFIEPTQNIRHFGVKLKHNANRAEIEGKRVVLVDDSIVRGTTSKKIVEMVQECGATEVHMRIASPPTAHSCFYGIDTPSPDELLAGRMDIAEMAKYIGVDSLAFLSNDGLYQAVAGQSRDNEAPQYCDACFTGEYPVPLIDQKDGAAKSPLSLLAETA